MPGPWTLAMHADTSEWSPRHSHCVISCGDGDLTIIGGFDQQKGSLNDVWTSKDGRSWTAVSGNSSASWSARDGHTAIYDERTGAIFVIGGADSDDGAMMVLNDIWRSFDKGKGRTAPHHHHHRTATATAPHRTAPPPHRHHRRLQRHVSAAACCRHPPASFTTPHASQVGRGR